MGNPANYKPIQGNITGSARGVRDSGGNEIRFDTAAGPGATAGLVPTSNGTGGVTWTNPSSTPAAAKGPMFWMSV